MPIDDLDIIPSPVDPDYERVRRDLLDPTRDLAKPPTGRLTEEALPKLCLDGDVPRRPQRPYGLDGKTAQTGQPDDSIGRLIYADTAPLATS